MRRGRRGGWRRGRIGWICVPTTAANDNHDTDATGLATDHRLHPTRTVTARRLAYRAAAGDATGTGVTARVLCRATRQFAAAVLADNGRILDFFCTKRTVLHDDLKRL